MQQLILFILFCVAVYYLYRKLVKKRGCDCPSSKSCCSLQQAAPQQQKESD